jgi:hypothetical protein
MDKLFEKLTVFLGVLSLIVLGIFYGALTWGLICWKFWYWFLLPVFPALPHVAFIECVGLMMFITLFRNHTAQQIIEDDYTTTSYNTVVFINFLMPWVILGMGYFVHVFIVK